LTGINQTLKITLFSFFLFCKLLLKCLPTEKCGNSIKKLFDFLPIINAIGGCCTDKTGNTAN